MENRPTAQMAAQIIEIEIVQPDQTLLLPAAKWSTDVQNTYKTTGEESLAGTDEIDQDKAGSVVKLSRAQVASKLLEDLDSSWIVEESEPCPDWLEEQIDLPIYEDLTPSPEPELYDSYSSTEKPLPMHLISLPLPELLGDLKPYVCSPPPDTKAGIQKFELEQSVIQEFTTPVWTPPLVPKVNALTPPDSPKDDDYLLTTMLDGIEPELCNELEELVRMHAENLVDDYKAPASAENNVECSATENHEEDSSDSNHSVCASSPCFSSDSGSGSSSEDPEWVPNSYTIPAAPQQKKKRITKPYNRPAPEDKKLRKKEQNKNAATRYRLKKKS